MGDNGHHIKQEQEAINNFLLRLVPVIEVMKEAITETWEAIKKWHEALPDEIKDAIKRAEKYKEN